MPDDDFKKIIDEADKKSAAKADAAVKDDLDAITREADQLESIFNSLKLTDPATHEKLVRIVEEARVKNEAVASVLTRIKAIGAAGQRLAASLGNLSGIGGLGAIAKALQLRA
jgi:hypothetical protein